MNSKTLEYYNVNAATFAEGTVSVDFKATQDRFLRKLNIGDHILDFGCGSGRDTKYFLQQGMKVDAIDGSEELCKFAAEYIGAPVRNMLFQDLSDKEKYLGITQPSALYLIKHKLKDRVDLRFYNEKDRSFHPKAYIFHYTDHNEIFIGSSNVSRSALTSGIEWNYRFSSKTDQKNYEIFYETFEDLFENHSIRIDDEELKRYSRNWHRPAVAQDLEKYDVKETEDANVRVIFEPRGAQIEALCALENTRNEGAKRALVQAATGARFILMTGRNARSNEENAMLA